MKRLILAAVLAVSLAAVVGASVQLLTTNGASDGPPVVKAMPYPRTTSPLPVPEVFIGQEPWRDPLRSARAAKPVPRSGFVSRCATGSAQPTDALTCRARPLTGGH
jgi:hypothetical protein